MTRSERALLWLTLGFAVGVALTYSFCSCANAQTHAWLDSYFTVPDSGLTGLFSYAKDDLNAVWYPPLYADSSTASGPPVLGPKGSTMRIWIWWPTSNQRANQLFVAVLRGAKWSDPSNPRLVRAARRDTLYYDATGRDTLGARWHWSDARGIVTVQRRPGDSTWVNERDAAIPAGLSPLPSYEEWAVAVKATTLAQFSDSLGPYYALRGERQR